MNFLNFISFVFTFFICTFVFAENKWDLMIETGGVWQHRNDIRIPSQGGTEVKAHLFGQGPFFHHRIESYYRINKRHTLRAVYAPFRVQVSGPINQSTEFNGQSFSSSQDLMIQYTFNSYRLSYIYGFWGFGNHQLNLGVTGKVRDANILFSQPGVNRSYANIGFVPLVYFEYQKALSPHWTLNFNVDAAAASQGRAIDGAIKFRRNMNQHSSLGLGLRSLEGGADNTRVFTFSWFNYAVLDLRFIW